MTLAQAATSGMFASAGRMCPFDYRYSPSVFRREPEIETETLYVVGGLYGNLAALDTVERLITAEPKPATLVFNGDFHWFDAEPRWFAAIEGRLSPHIALRGNVETEIARADDVGAGCGCAYPESVGNGIVQRSNEILLALRDVARGQSGVPQRLNTLPMHLVARVGDARVGIVHGDAWSLAGWRFAQDSLDSRQEGWAELQNRSGIDIFASTHTCLAALRRLETETGGLTVINNGAAGMPNFRGTRFGLISRISTHSSPHRAVYQFESAGVWLDAIAVEYDHDAFLDQFATRWEKDSPAYASYFNRIVNGPDYDLAQALPPR